MADKGINFSAAMVTALLAGRKTQTRRLMPQQGALRRMYAPIVSATRILNYAGEEEIGRAPFSVGDRLYVREAYYQFGHWEPVDGQLTKGGRQKWAFVGASLMVQFEEPEGGCVAARDREMPFMPRWHKRLGRFMPRRLSRVWLAVTDVRVQRLQECSNEDAQAEGREICPSCGDSGWVNSGPDGGWQCEVQGCGDEDRDWYATLWNSLHTAEGERWQDNPWVVAVSFDVHLGNIDAAITIKDL